MTKGKDEYCTPTPTGKRLGEVMYRRLRKAGAFKKSRYWSQLSNARQSWWWQLGCQIERDMKELEGK